MQYILRKYSIFVAGIIGACKADLFNGVLVLYNRKYYFYMSNSQVYGHFRISYGPN